MIYLWVILGLIFLWGMIWLSSDYIYDNLMALIERRKRAHRRAIKSKAGRY